MRVLLTGASSFTGFWFVRELRRAGHEVACLFQGASAQEYDGLRGQRVRELLSGGESHFGVSFGSSKFLEIASQGWDVLAHHAADVTDYRSLDFDVVRALDRNTKNLREVFSALRQTQGSRVVLTGSVFEPDEGAGSDGLPAILPYGLSKGLTSQVFRYEAQLAGLHLGKFVIPNPFGSFQEPRFVQYLLKTWGQRETARVGTPDYVRDNIPVQLLALDYVDFLTTLPRTKGFSKRDPSGLVGSQAAFAELVAQEMRTRLGLECRVELPTQVDFSEPRVRINTDSAFQRHSSWNLSAVWDDLAQEVRSV